MKHLFLTPGLLLLAVVAAAQPPAASPAGPGLTPTAPAIADGDIIPDGPILAKAATFARFHR